MFLFSPFFYKNKPLLIKGFFLLLIFFSIFVFCGCNRSQKPQEKKRVLKYWRIEDKKEDLEPLFEAFKKTHPNVDFEYRQLRKEDYENELLNALAEDKGPDLFNIPNTWMKKYLPKLEPAPQFVNYVQMDSDNKENGKLIVSKVRNINKSDLINNYVDQVYKDVVWTMLNLKTNQEEENIYGIPFALDILSLYYNEDILKGAKLANPALTWSEFQKHVIKITKIDKKNNILLSGGAIGCGENVNYSVDILSLLMMQNGAEMTMGNTVAFHLIPKTLSNRRYPPGLEALQFYIQFSDPTLESYTWNEDMVESLDAFITGQTAYYFGYARDRDILRKRAPKLNFQVVQAPVISGGKNISMANYFVECVSKKSFNRELAWEFLYFAMRPQNNELYIDKTKRPTVLRGLINEQLKDKKAEPFVRQVLVAQSWYKGADYPKAREYMIDMINKARKGNIELKEILSHSAAKVTSTY
jgi:ABC-type glycerol-3-phosphate transport system substrate-binding protein